MSLESRWQLVIGYEESEAAVESLMKEDRL